MIPRLAEYIWLDATEPTEKLRSKTRVVFLPKEGDIDTGCFPIWGFDGSSTGQANTTDSDLRLKPVRLTPDPFRGNGHFLALCEVQNSDGTPHESNTRAKLRKVLELGSEEHDPWVGFEQEYTLFKGRTPLGWPDGGYPAPQGPFYCGVGNEEAFGRMIVEDHTTACLKTGLMLFGINAEVMPGQWEFQIGYRGMEDEKADPLIVSDHLWLARWLLYRIGEKYSVQPVFDPKPVEGEWNGAGAHTNISTAKMRAPETGMVAILSAIQRLANNHDLHITYYGFGLNRRLTGCNETSKISKFTSGVGDRNASIRIPHSVNEKGYGYIEDRRPGANCDPYRVCMILLKTICGIETDE